MVQRRVQNCLDLVLVWLTGLIAKDPDFFLDINGINSFFFSGVGYNLQQAERTGFVDLPTSLC